MSTHQAAGRHYVSGPGLAPFVDDPRRACRGADPNLFFPDQPGAAGEPAKAICRSCPFMRACADWATDAHEEHGIWGATTPGDRAMIRRSNQGGRAA